MADLYYSLPKRGKEARCTGDHQLCLLCAPSPIRRLSSCLWTPKKCCAPSRSICWKCAQPQDPKRQLSRQHHQLSGGVFAKGDRRLAPGHCGSLQSARGYFDGWEECFKLRYLAADLADLSIDPGILLPASHWSGRSDALVPWITASPTNIWYGSTKALAPRLPQPCNRACHGCGANHLLEVLPDYSKNLV